MNFEKRIDNYQFLLNAMIGKGSFGTVYKGKNIETDEIVAIKVIDLKRLNYQSNQQLQSEIESLRQLNNQNVVKMHKVYQTPNNIYIISEFCDGGDLRELIQKKCVNENLAITIIMQLLDGYRDLFKNKILHRDIKPANILISNDTLKIADFGFSKRIEDLTDVMTSIAGTPLYMAPQVLMRMPYTAKCDIWSIGMILYELLFQKTPYTAQNIVDLIHQMQKTVISIPSNAKISKEMKEFILGCLQFDEKDRLGWEEVYKHELFGNYFKEKVKKPLEQSNDVVNKERKSAQQTRKIVQYQKQERKSAQYQEQEKQDKSHKNYQDQLVKHYLERQYQQNQKICIKNLNFTKGLFNLSQFLKMNGQYLDNINSQLLNQCYKWLKHQTILRTKCIFQCLALEVENWMQISELEQYVVQGQCKQFIRQLSEFHDIMKGKYSDLNEIEQLKDKDSLESLKESMEVLKLTLQEALTEMNMQNQQQNSVQFCFLYMILQTVLVIKQIQEQGLSYSVEIQYDDIQFIQKLPQEDIIHKITQIVS